MESKRENFPDLDAAFAWLESFANFEKRPAAAAEYRLDRMAAMLAAFGNPQNSAPAIHIAGSKGKGSTAAFCAAVLGRAGYRVGVYASPHVSDYRERIRLGSDFFPDGAYLDAVARLRRKTEAWAADAAWPWGEPTTFELLTLAAYLIFAAAGVDWMVVETGLGGRLDATNLMPSRACLITALELEHTEVLGDTIELIAGEKAGIFKTGALLCSASQEPAALAVLQERAAGLGGVLELPAPGFRYEDRRFVLAAAPGADFDIAVALGIAGAVQYANAELAARSLAGLWRRGELPRLADAAALAAAVGEGLAAASLPGRMESLWLDAAGRRVELVLDGAHTAQSVAHAARDFAPRPGDLLLFGSVSGKKHAEMAAALAGKFDIVIVTTPGTFKASDPAAVHRSFAAAAPGARLVPDTAAALAEAVAALGRRPGSRCLVCGSFYLVGAVKKLAAARGAGAGHGKEP